MIAETSAEFIFSTSALPPSGVDCASPSTASILAPPNALMPPAALISSIAMLAGIGQRTGYRMQDADLHHSRLRAHYDRRVDQTSGRHSAQSGRLQKPA